jgi:hypothetical protein
MSIWLDKVIHQENLSQVSVCKDSKVFYICVLFFDVDTLLTVDSMLYKSFVRVQIVKDGICITFNWRCHHHNFKIFVGFSETFFIVRADVESNLEEVRSKASTFLKCPDFNYIWRTISGFMGLLCREVQWMSVSSRSKTIVFSEDIKGKITCLFSKW